MSTRKIEVNEDDLKKVILMLKLSKPHLKLPPQELFLSNMWRVAPKLADKLMKKAGLTMTTNKGRITLKPIGEVTSEVADKDVPIEEKLTEAKSEEISNILEKPAVKIPRCRKRKK